MGVHRVDIVLGQKPPEGRWDEVRHKISRILTWGFPEMGESPITGWFIMDNPIKMI
jgi:hypothetical protein